MIPVLALAAAAAGQSGAATPAGHAAHAAHGTHAAHTAPAGSGAAAPAPPAGPAATRPPAPPADHAADRFYDPAAMASARRLLRREHGGMRTAMLLFNLAEYQARRGRDALRWDGEAWLGGDVDRLVLATEGEASPGHRADEAEVQALLGHAIGPYFDLRGGLRQDVGPRPSRTYATLGVEGIAPYWIAVEATAFLSHRGKLSARIKALYDQRITQRIVVQPRAELNLALEDDRARELGRGLANAELGLRIRYEIRREFAPYLGVNWLRRVGRSADFVRAAGRRAGDTSLVTGVRFWL